MKSIKHWLHCVFQRRREEEIKCDKPTIRKMNILEECISSAVIVDDQEQEIRELSELLKDNGIYVEVYIYDGDIHADGIGKRKNRNIIFVDLMLNNNQNQVRENISSVINVLKKLTDGDCYGGYGLVVWTKHQEHVQQLKDALSSARKTDNDENTNEDDEEESIDVHLDNPPLFVVGLDKGKYLRTGAQNDYSSLKDDLEECLSNEKSAYFYILWNASVEKAKSSLLQAFYEMGDNYGSCDAKILHLLGLLAKNQTGIKKVDDYPYLTADAYKAFDELLYSELMVQQKDFGLPLFNAQAVNPFDSVEQNQILSGKLNSMFFIDTVCLSQNDVGPGNVYIVKDERSPLVIRAKASDKFKENERKKLDKIQSKNREQQERRPNNPQLQEEFDLYEPECWDVAIELTPPCDYSQEKRKMARLIGGYIFDVPVDTYPGAKEKAKIDEMKCLPNNDSIKEYSLGPIFLKDKVRYLVFDFNYLLTEQLDSLKNASQYEILFRAKPKLFAHILQCFSSHASRLGLGNIKVG